MLNTAVCDDDSIHLKLAEQLVRDYLSSEGIRHVIQPFANAGDLLGEIRENEYSPDIAVLDIEMDGEDGISLARKINTLLPLCRIIFLTSYSDYAQDVYEAEHIWFVLKKDASVYFPQAMKKALRSMKEQKTVSPGIIVMEKGVSSFVPLDEVLYISKVGRKAMIRCTDRDLSDTRRPGLLIPEHMERYFIRCHQGYWHNARTIRELDHDEFILANGEHIPVSRTFRDEARKQFFALLHQTK